MTDDPTYLFHHNGWRVHGRMDLGHLWVIGSGISFEELQDIKARVWGADARAIEVYPAAGNVVNSIDCRHLWRLGEHDFAPDLLGSSIEADSLMARHALAWAEARGQR